MNMEQGWSYQNEQKACLDISIFIFVSEQIKRTKIPAKLVFQIPAEG